jgi:hypothetical protein
MSNSIQRRNSRRRRGNAGIKRRCEQASLREHIHDLKMAAPVLTPMRFGTSLRYFFTTSDGSAANITFASLMNLIGVTKTTTTMTSLIEACKVRRLKIWVQGKVTVNTDDGTTPSQAGNVCHVSVRDSAVPGIGVEKEFVLTTSNAKGVYWEYTPRGFASEWFNLDVLASSLPFFVITPNPGHSPWVEIDVSLQLCTSNSMASAAALVLQTTVQTTTAGAVAYPYLDSMGDDTTEGTQVLAPFYNNNVSVNLPRPMLTDHTSVRLPKLSLSRDAHQACASSSSAPPRQTRG